MCRGHSLGMRGGVTVWIELPNAAAGNTELICLVGCRLVFEPKGDNRLASLVIYHPCRYGPLTLYGEQAESVYAYVSAGVSIRPKGNGQDLATPSTSTPLLARCGEVE